MDERTETAPEPPDRATYRQPQQVRSRQTFETLLDAAGALLGEVGIERISSNLICERARLTPPAFYRYFDDKYAIIAALAERLMLRQNAALEAWIAQWRGHPVEVLAAHAIDLVRDTATISDTEPGALWILRALRAVPRLTVIRLESHAYVTGVMTDLYAPLLPTVPRDVIARRVRLGIEFAYSLDEMIREVPVDREALFNDARPVFEAMGRYADYR